MDEEFRAHIALRADDLERQGMLRKDAERVARVEFGSVESHKSDGRTVRGVQWMDELRDNLSFAVRGITRRPLQALIIIVTLSLGIGVSASVFTVVDAL